MPKYYKIITNNSHFADEYNITDVTTIANGTEFHAHPSHSPTDWITPGVPMIRFAESAFTTLLWYELLTKQTDEIGIYEVTPLGQVTKQKSPDKYGLMQCGAQSIKIGKQITLEELVRQIKRDFKLRKLKKKNPFPEFETANIIYRWLDDSNKK